jgi:hypothetical protein
VQLVFDWKLRDESEQEPTRPEFVATKNRRNPITGLDEKVCSATFTL